VILSCVTGKYNAIGITPKDEKREYMGCLRGHTSNPTNSKLDSRTNSKQLLKEDAPEGT